MLPSCAGTLAPASRAADALLPLGFPRPLPQVSSLQVYDELLESALRAVGAGPRNLALHGPWLWLLDSFCEAYAVGRNYARLRQASWVFLLLLLLLV